MKYFTELQDLPILDLYSELNAVVAKHKLNWKHSNQISLNHVNPNSTDVYFGVGSLIYDWHNSHTIITDTGEEKRIIPNRETQLRETDFQFICNQFKGTLFEHTYNALKARYNIGRVRLMKSESKTCLSWHTDDTPRIHYPIKTQAGCFMVIEDEILHMTQHTWWYTNTLFHHTAFNSSLESRIHLVVSIL